MWQTVLCIGQSGGAAAKLIWRWLPLVYVYVCATALACPFALRVAARLITIASFFGNIHASPCCCPIYMQVGYCFLPSSSTTKYNIIYTPPFSIRRVPSPFHRSASRLYSAAPIVCRLSTGDAGMVWRPGGSTAVLIPLRSPLRA
ncbi:hypothetical protein M441DRAFT_282642 [Trichoderma asperellum CBS 433.97]|uniref:Uncharacterized protein n=1 Tax=Trichoderma asperellum (strain ATCC 204424 / CBS 433.97 / NBRC 101777) TaxID=1042311 RepID=A0A2T3YVN1_TRIA4|nr:hypothetical protein M441DRAFT_282642 [Trichoderma asperellum CBS 433.97]PTB36619.1 hypothetical protein M441DRAFT_282642 [Trichoderma asperellum CBS 433.97]